MAYMHCVCVYTNNRLIEDALMDADLHHPQNKLFFAFQFARVCVHEMSARIRVQPARMSRIIYILHLMYAIQSISSQSAAASAVENLRSNRLRLQVQAR